MVIEVWSLSPVSDLLNLLFIEIKLDCAIDIDKFSQTTADWIV